MIILTTAMQKEFDGVTALLDAPIVPQDNACSGWLNGIREVLVVKTGIGKVNAAISLTQILERCKDVERVVSLGCAGAATPTLHAGDIVVGNSYCYYDVWCGEPNVNGQVQGMPAVLHTASTNIRNKEEVAAIGMIASGDWFVQSKEKVEDIRDYLPQLYDIVAIDMESAALAHVCCTYGVPFDAFRVISDNPLLPQQEKQYADFWQMATNKYFQILTSLV